MEFTKKGDVKWQMQRNMQKTTKDSKRRIGQLVVRGRPKGSSKQAYETGTLKFQIGLICFGQLPIYHVGKFGHFINFSYT